MCAGCDPESYTWPDVSSDGTSPTDPYGWLSDDLGYDEGPIPWAELKAIRAAVYARRNPSP